MNGFVHESDDSGNGSPFSSPQSLHPSVRDAEIASYQESEMPPVSSNQFMYMATNRTFSGFASDVFGPNRYGVPRILQIRSEKTRVVRAFQLVRTDRDGDGDIRYWEYRNVDGIKVVVFNT